MRAGNVDADAGDAGDHVAGAGIGSADRVVLRHQVDIHAGIAVAERVLARGIGADVIAFDDVAVRTKGSVVLRAIDGDAKGAVARDNVARAGGGPADGVVVAVVVDRYACICVAQRSCTAGVGADVIALDGIALRI